METDAYVIAEGYGRCLEGWQRAQRALRAALGQCRDAGRHPDTDPEVALCLQDRRAWERLLREVPQFLVFTRPTHGR